MTDRKPEDNLGSALFPISSSTFLTIYPLHLPIHLSLSTFHIIVIISAKWIPTYKYLYNVDRILSITLETSIIRVTYPYICNRYKVKVASTYNFITILLHSPSLSLAHLANACTQGIHRTHIILSF